MADFEKLTLSTGPESPLLLETFRHIYYNLMTFGDSATALPLYIKDTALFDSLSIREGSPGRVVGERYVINRYQDVTAPERTEIGIIQSPGLRFEHANRDAKTLVAFMSFKKTAIDEKAVFNGHILLLDSGEIEVGGECFLSPDALKLDEEMKNYANDVGLRSIWRSYSAEHRGARISLNKPVGENLGNSILRALEDMRLSSKE